MRTLVTLIAVGGVLGGAAAAPSRAQSLERRVSAVADGSAQLSFASRPGVCGNGRGSIGTGGNTIVGNYSSGSGYRDSREWCVPGPVRVVLTVRDGAVDRARVFVGGGDSVGGNDSRADVRDLGVVSASEAAGYLLDLAVHAPGRVGENAILAAVLADSVTPWPALLQLARNESTSHRTRESATFWLSRAAAAAVNHRPLFSEHYDYESPRDEVRAAAVFALSQQPRDDGIPALIRVARTNSEPSLRDKALFWLGQSGDQRVLDLFAELLEIR